MASRAPSPSRRPPAPCPQQLPSPAAPRPVPPAAAVDPAVEPLRRANPHGYRYVRPGHLAVVAGSGRPWFIGRVCDVSARPWGRTPAFVRVINVDSGDVERIPAPWIVALMSERGLA